MTFSLRARALVPCFMFATLAVATAAPTYTNIFSFPFTSSPGFRLSGKPLLASDGALYGSTHRIFGPDWAGSGLIYRMNKDGTGYTVLRRFEESYGPAPGELIETSERELWGTTGRIGAGGLFKMNLDGSGFTNLHIFNVRPNGALLESRDGAIYGAAGDEEYAGLIYKINKDGSGFTVLRQFPLAQPTGSLIEDAEGFLYGTTRRDGGVTNKGSIFKMGKDGTQYTNLYSFRGEGDGENPYHGVIEGSDGALYGTTGSIGFNGHGSVYKINKDGTGFTVLRSSDPYTGGCCGPIGSTNPPAPPRHGMMLQDLIEGSDGALYVSGLEDLASVIFKIGKDGGGYSVLKTLGNIYDLAFPQGLIEGPGGELYGTTEKGGDAGSGTVFTISKSGSDYVELRTFDGWGAKGIYPGTLIYGNDNVLYGSSWYGGSNQVGAVYKINTDGSDFNVIYNFTGGADGTVGALLFHGSDGLLYGVASSGGIVFRLNTQGGDFQVVHQFTNGDACSALIEGPDGLLYGGTKGVLGPGPLPVEVAAPTFFKMNKDGSGYETFYTYPAPALFGLAVAFLAGSDGSIYGVKNNPFELFKFQVGGVGLQTLAAPRRSVASFSQFEGSDGAIYSVWPAPHRDECPSCSAAIARINKDGSNLTLIHNLGMDVSYPRILEGPDGFIYGTGVSDTPGPGTIFRLAKDGTRYTNLFTYPLDKGRLAPTFIKGGRSDLYGLTSGGTDYVGSIFKIHVPILAPILTGGATWSTEVVLSWTSEDPRTAEFVIFRKTGTNAAFAEIARVAGNVRVFRDTNLAPVTTYKYLVTATDGIEYSDYSNRAMVTTPAQERFATLVSVAEGDGFVAEANKFSNLGAMAFPLSAGSAAIRAGDTSLDQQVKGIVSFRTSDLRDNATVIYARLKLRRGVMYGNPFDVLGRCFVDIKNGLGFGNTPQLKPHDFQWPATKRIGVLMPDSNNEWYYVRLDYKSLAYVDRTGFTQFRLCFERADNGDLAPDYIGWYSAEYAKPDYRPVLEIIYR